MADILIRGMEMPKNCTECPCFSQWDDCGINHEWKFADEFDKTKDRLPSCPLIPLPEGHGRLIDADALQAKFELMENAFAEHGRPYSFAFKDGGEMCAEWWTVQDALSREPTIVPAEGGTDNG